MGIEALLGDKTVASFNNEAALSEYVKAYAPEIEKLWKRLVEIRDEIKGGMLEEAARCNVQLDSYDGDTFVCELNTAIQELVYMFGECFTVEEPKKIEELIR